MATHPDIMAPLLPGTDPTLASYQDIALTFGASMVPPTHAMLAPDLVTKRQGELRRGIVKELSAAQTNTRIGDFAKGIEGYGESVITLRDMTAAACDTCPFRGTLTCSVLGGLAVERARTHGTTLQLAQTGKYGEKLVQSLLAKGTTKGELDHVALVCPIASVLESYAPRPNVIPQDIGALALLAGIVLTNTYLAFNTVTPVAAARNGSVIVRGALISAPVLEAPTYSPQQMLIPTASQQPNVQKTQLQ